MNLVRLILPPVLAILLCIAPAEAQDDSSSEFFSAYQEFQRAEKLEREGRTNDAIAKFRYVAAQLGQLKSQHPDWQPLVVDFRLKKTQEAILRLEGALGSSTISSPTLGPPPDLAESTPDEVLPPVHPVRAPLPSGPTISISADEAPPARLSKEQVTATPAAPAPAELENLRGQLAAEKGKSSELEEQIKGGESEVSGIRAELEQTKAALDEINRQLEESKNKPESAPPSGDAASGEEAKRLSAAAKELEQSLAAANAEKADLTAQLTAAKAQADAVKTELESAKSEAEAAKTRATALETEKESLVTERDTARKETETAQGEMQTLTSRVTELEEERTQLITARDTAQKEAADAKTALEKNAELIESNRQLEEKLADATKQIAGMETDAAAKAEVITGLQKDLDNVRHDLAGAQTKLKDDRERFDKLQSVNDQLLKEYDEVTGALAAVKLGDVTATEAKLLQEENEVLRGIIMRQIKEQARREQAYRLAQEEMQRLEIRSDTLNDKINELAKPTLELTDAEQEMLKRPVVTLLDADAAKMSAQVAAVKLPESAASPAPRGTPPSTEGAGGTAVADPSTEPPSEGAAAARSLSTELSPELLAMVNQAREQFVKGNFAQAEELYQNFLERQPSNVVALANLGVAQFRQGKLTAAQLALEKAVKVEPNDAFSLTTLGAVMIEQGRIDDAVNYLERANAALPDDAITLNYLGVASSQLGQFGKAEQSLRRAITVRPEYAEAHFNLAVIYATAKPPSIALAKRHYEKALELGAGPDKRLASMLQSEKAEKSEKAD
ncbi:MAG: tetratricopeptide repeat protein [Chthoniobacterales bacterium]